MPALTNNTARKPLKRRKESSRAPRERGERNRSRSPNDDNSSESPHSSRSPPRHSGDDNFDDVLKKIDSNLLALNNTRHTPSHRPAPASDRGLSPDISSFDSPFNRSIAAESIKESGRSENDFMYLNNLYSFSAARRSARRPFAVPFECSGPNPPFGFQPQEDNHVSENATKLKGLQRLRTAEEEFEYERLLREEKGYEIKRMIGDGNCLFRSVADQLFGDQEKHAQVRRDCMDYMERNREHFSQYVVEDFDAYLARKRTNGVYGNHVEIQSIAELYNRRVEIYCYELAPLNIFQGEMALSDATPIRISYHNGCHFNSVVDTRHPFVPLGPEMPQSYKRSSEPSVEASIVEAAMAESEQKDIEMEVLKSVEKESEQKDLEAAMLSTAQLDSGMADTEAQMVRTVEKESEERDLEAQMIKTVQEESEARNLEDEILRQVMLDSAKEANVSPYSQNDDDFMLQLALQQSRMDSLSGLFKSIKIPPFSSQPPPPPSSQSLSSKKP